MNFESIGLHVPQILLPNSSVDLNKWAVVACDQYTSQPEYWHETEAIVGDTPSTLRLTLPEIFLEQDNEESRIKAINATMEHYYKSKTLVYQNRGFILIDRKTAHKPSRKGLIVALDLEKYDYSSGAKTLIRATEGTIVSRLHPRIRIRQNATLELPHIMVLIDDPNKQIIEPLFEENLKTLYDTDLMQNGGHITAKLIDDNKLINNIAKHLTKLAEPARFNDYYNLKDEPPLLYAMGDGNHSFATAKALWEKIKSKSSDYNNVMNHPARFALVELVNIHDSGMSFEPIHRLLFNINIEKIFEEMELFFNVQGSSINYCYFASKHQMFNAKEKIDNKSSHTIAFISMLGYGLLTIKNPRKHIPVGSLQNFINSFIENKSDAGVDYIHGKQVIEELGSKPDHIGFFLDVLDKSDLFKTVIVDGALPRKTFSMGEADEKRFYMEARKIV